MTRGTELLLQGPSVLDTTLPAGLDAAPVCWHGTHTPAARCPGEREPH